MPSCTPLRFTRWTGPGRRRLSLVDHVSFLVMRRRKVSTAFAFDPDFTSAGFQLFAA
ncbi:MAG TPA: hypothetical protein VEL79_21840 [Vicinamibacterales bacterium]|nr:hypothetical protein [Vicinamibacterales bacterium]